MKYFLDSVNKEDMEKWLPIVDGITSNPILLDEANITIEEFLQNLFSLPKGKDKKVFIQVSSWPQVVKTIEMWNGILDEKKNNINNNLIFKVTMHPNFFPLIQRLKNSDANVAATTIYDIIQINQAIEFGCNYTMVYCHKNENPDLFKQAHKLKELTKSNIQLVGASFRGKHEIIDAMLSGMDYVTATPKSLEEAFSNAQLEADFIKLYA